MFYDLREEIASHLEKVGCPVCLNTRYSLVLRCALSPGEAYLLVGECSHCGNKFDVLTVPTLDDICAQAEHKFLPHPCKCGGTTVLNFLCDLNSEDCYFAGICSGCGARWRTLSSLPNGYEEESQRLSVPHRKNFRLE